MITRKRIKETKKDPTNKTVVNSKKLKFDEISESEFMKFCTHLKSDAKTIVDNHGKSCKKLLSFIMNQNSYWIPKHVNTKYNKICKFCTNENEWSGCNINWLINTDFLVPACLFEYTRRKHKNQIIPGVVMFSQIVGGSGFLISNNRVITAKHVLGETENLSKIGQYKIGFIKNELLLLKCTEETTDENDLAFMDIVYRFDWEHETISESELKYVQNYSTVNIDSDVTCYGFPSIYLHESDYGDPKQRDGPEKLVTVNKEKYVAWEPPMWNSVNSDYVDIRLRPKRKNKGLKSVYNAFYHGAIKYGGFSGGPIFQNDKIVGIHHGWDDKICLGLATVATSIPELDLE